MRNPLLTLARCCAEWRSLRRFPGVFSVRDALKDLRYVLQPRRITRWEARRFIARRLELERLPDRGHEVRLKGEGISFFWLGEDSSGLADAVRQVVDSRHPHCYTTPPVQLNSSSRVLDVGACEGLLACRLLRQGQAAQVHCFEPSARTAALLRKAAELNRCADRMRIEIAAVGAVSGQVSFFDSDVPEANRVLEPGQAGGTTVRQIALDDYCREHNLALTSNDLIKVDAEGADVDVIRGAARIIRQSSPQIAITTYHNPEHAVDLICLLRSLQPKYRFRLKGFTLWNSPHVPRPVLLQAAV